MRKKIRDIIEGQARLPFGEGQSGLLSYAHPLERRAFFILGALLFLVCAVYMYFVMTSVMHVAGREEAAIQASRLSAEVARLESEYLSRTESITEPYAKTRGFVSISKRSFVEGASVSIDNRR